MGSTEDEDSLEMGSTEDEDSVATEEDSIAAEEELESAFGEETQEESNAKEAAREINNVLVFMP